MIIVVLVILVALLILGERQADRRKKLEFDMVFYALIMAIFAVMLISNWQASDWLTRGLQLLVMASAAWRILDNVTKLKASKKA